MTTATPGTNTVVQIDWTTDKSHEYYNLHTARHAGWTFMIRSRNGGCTLTATHMDHRSHESEHVYAADAQAKAVEMMHPSEAMSWLSEDVPLVGMVHTASWGPLYFAAVTTDGGLLRFGYRVDGDLSDDILVLTSMREVREAAQDVLVDHYGPVRPVVDVPLPEAAASPAERLSDAFTYTTASDVPVRAIEAALRRAGLRLADITPLHHGITDPVTRLSRALYAAHGIGIGYDDVAELLRRAGLTLS